MLIKTTAGTTVPFENIIRIWSLGEVPEGQSIRVYQTLPETSGGWQETELVVSRDEFERIQTVAPQLVARGSRPANPPHWYGRRRGVK